MRLIIDNAEMHVYWHMKSQLILRDDELLLEYVENFNRIFYRDTSKLTPVAVAKLKRFVNQKLRGHFAYEERRIFPALLRAGFGVKVTLCIAGLRKDHARFLKETKRLSRLLSTPAPTAADFKVLRKALLDFGARLRKHSTKENELFPSLV